MEKTIESWTKKIEKNRRQKMGKLQSRMLWNLMYGQIVPFQDYCKAQSRYTRYVIMWNNSIREFKMAGMNIQVHPGKLGGTWTEKIELVQ